MAIAPYYWREAREKAPVHVQIRLTKRPDGLRDDSNVAGPVVRIFRDDTGRLKRGDVISFTVNWRDGRRPRDTGEPIVLGRQRFWFELAWLHAARYVEAYLQPDGNGFELVWDQATLLLRETDDPANPVEGEDYGIQVSDEVIRRASQPRPWYRPW
jgi:hypothetical protein